MFTEAKFATSVCNTDYSRLHQNENKLYDIYNWWYLTRGFKICTLFQPPNTQVGTELL